MVDEKLIPVYVQSASGHDTFNVTQARLGEVVKEQLEDDKWVTTEKADGSTEILTKADLPNCNDCEDDTEDIEDSEDADSDEDDSKADNTWVDKGTTPKKTAKTTTKTFESRFENVVSATATHKAKGG